MAIRLDRERRAASTNRGAANLPPLSPVFLHEADAAYWAHLKIGERRDREYGGVIVKNPDGQFLATEPVPGDEMQFNLLKVLGVGTDGYYQQPKGYTCVASYHSHPAQHQLIQSRNRTFDSRMVKAFLGFFSGSDFTHDVDDREFFPAAYLSGPDGSLIRYAPSGSAQERSFALWIKAGKPLKNPVGVYGPFSELVKKISLLGELTLVVPTSLWGGSAGKVPADWVVFEPFTNPAVTLPPLCTAIFQRAEEAVRAAQSASGQRTSGFVLKHRQRESYVATFGQAEQLPLFSPLGVFAQRADGLWQLPSSYRIEAIHYRPASSSVERSVREPWLYLNFFTPAEVVAAMIQAKATAGVQDSSRGLGLYRHATDGGLLKLKLAVADTTPGLEDSNAQAALLNGTLTPRQYVRRVIAATDVSVVYPGKLWRDKGAVDVRSPALNAVYGASWNRSFLSANDAALHAHELIGNRRDRYYGGYVLKGADGRFTVTNPLESAANPFDDTLFFRADNQGPLIPPEHYEVQARYGSHPALSMIDPEWVRQRGWTREQALINLQVFAPDEVLSILRSRHVAYLSGGADCLLAYVPSGSPREQTLLASLAGNTTQSRAPVKWVSELAESGALRVIQGNQLWGPRSVVGSSWLAHATYAARLGPPEFTLFGAVFGSANEAARDLHRRVHGRNLRTADCFAFILKHKDQEQYIASEVECVDSVNTLFRLNSLFAVTAQGGYRFPEGFVLHALFRSQQWPPSGLDAANTWLTTYFVTPLVLYIALYESIRRGKQYNSGNNLPVYFSTLDGALLRYVVQPMVIGQAGAAEIELEEATRQLTGGQLTPRDFLRRWAGRGQLEVVRTSQCWDRVGPLGITWSGYDNIMRRRLSPGLANADDAARHAAALVGQGRKRLYGGVILRFANGLFAATEPLAVPPQGFTFSWIYPDQIVSRGLYPTGSTLVARYSSRVEQEVPILLSATQKAVYTSMIPSAVLSNLLRREAHIKREYVFGPRGSILSYQLSGSAAETALKNQLAPRNLVKAELADNDIEYAIRAGSLLPEEFVTRAALAGSVRVIEGNALWGPVRELSNGFVPYTPRAGAFEIRASVADPAYSPVFTRAFDAVRHVQREFKAGPQITFGYVLKSVNKPLYKVTLPLVRASFADLRQVFIAGQLPSGYALDGLYLGADEDAIAMTGDDMAHNFFGAQVIANALHFVSHAIRGQVLALYLMCADGALLRYRFATPERLHGFMSQAPRLRAQLQDGTLRVRDYVRQLAGMGELHVRLTSQTWSRKGRVTAQWQPRENPHSFLNDPYFHSFCSPLFAHADDAAHFAHRQVGPYTGKQYLAAVLVPPQTPGYVAIDPVKDFDEGDGASTLEWLFRIGHSGFDVPHTNALYFYSIAAVHAFYKAIPSTSSTAVLDLALLDNFTAHQDLQRYMDVLQSNRPQAESCYLSCRDGALLRYIPGFTTEETALLSPSLQPNPSELVSRLRRTGTLSVLSTGLFWTQAGPLPETWQTADVQARPDGDEAGFGRDKDEL
ncbi:DUF4329 domain-containing protein [Pseudomonas yamanorum]